ncbi:uncharacterized protein TM35_000044540 [Trypanosoma theileri]|uniref:Uncharacterized protein n=1 Tax=Trypanosoma theileri TaxID=67003 RepID=A0A1X0P736_9TRYP|nr:uncharacterized protein TM35_000044540 [Trypanosoma theileri]ORC92240.1 hypothetical protein TM35_000044540 [Trypanosoma theileri]
MKRKAKKEQQLQNGSAVKSTTAAERKGNATVVINPKEDNDIAEIFGIIRKGKKQEGDNNNKKHNSKMDSKQNTTTNTPVEPRSDGLYRAPEKTLELSDAAFFDVPSQRRRGRGGKSSATAEISGDVLQREGVHRIITMEELQKITSSNPKAGTTPNCPFDCDCCF